MSIEHDPARTMRRLNVVGFGLVALMVIGFGGWAMRSELSGAVIAPGFVVVESNVKKVQHPTGGIVGEILVKEGDVVAAGQVVMRLDDTVTRSTLGVVRSQLDEALARETRLLAERDGADDMAFPEDLLSRHAEKTVQAATQGELKLFASRRSGRHGQRSQLRERVAQSNEEIRGLSAQQEAKEREISFIGEELTGVTALWAKNLVSMPRLMVLQRDKAKLEGERGQYIADIARSRGKINETELQILQLEQDFATDVLKDLRETQGKIAELREKLVAAEDQLKRIDIRAPQSGVVHQMAVHTVGGVIANGEAVMLVVPVADALVIEGRVSPQDIDQIQVGSPATVRIMAGNQRTMPDLKAELSRVSADLTREQGSGGQPGATYYSVRLALAPEEVARLGGLRLVPGMPAETFIQTTSRTPLEYLLKPLNDQIAHTFRER
jgi:HlyD family secretion protein